MTEALKRMVDAMAAELDRQVQVGEVDTTVHEGQIGPPTWISLDDVDLEKVARAALDALAGKYDANGLTAEQAARIRTGTTPLHLKPEDGFSCYIPGVGLWIGQVGWAIAPEYMAAKAKAENDPT